MFVRMCFLAAWDRDGIHSCARFRVSLNRLAGNRPCSAQNVAAVASEENFRRPQANGFAGSVY